MRKWLQILAFLAMLPAFLVLVVLALVGYVVHGLALNAAVWMSWCPRGRYVLLVYSDSPIWHDYIQGRLIPRLPPGTVLLNWSERRKWRWHSLPVRLARFFGGSREFNPLVVVFRPFRWGRAFRFWQAFKDRKRGDGRTLAKVESDLFAYLDRSHPSANDRATDDGVADDLAGSDAPDGR